MCLISFPFPINGKKNDMISKDYKESHGILHMPLKRRHCPIFIKTPVYIATPFPQGSGICGEEEAERLLTAIGAE